MMELKKTCSAGRQYTAKFSVDTGSGNAQMFSSSNDFAATLSLRDANGRSFRVSTGPWSSSGNGRQEFMIYFYSDASKSQPAELIARLPQKIQELRIPFQFNDI